MAIRQKIEEPRFKQALIPLQQHIAKADELFDGWGVTDLYSTGCKQLDAYLGGGYGRKGNGYEIILLTGSPGVGKSTIALNMVLDPIEKGVNTMLAVLEDEPGDVINRLRMMTNSEIDNRRNVFFADDQSEGYTLDQALEAIEQWFKACDVVLIDHMEYLWAGVIGQTEHDKWTQQEIFMRKCNTLMKGNGKTLILVQHTNKTSELGFGRVKGSSSLAQTATKFMEVYRDNNGINWLKLWKTRFTAYRDEPLQIEINKFKVSGV
jgi:predicted ATP-dependent serine protease